MIGYSHDITPYIMDKPTSIIVFDKYNKELRRREGKVEPGSGNLREQHEFLADGVTSASTLLSYTPEGLLEKVIGPENYRKQSYWISYEYDSGTRTHITRVSDAFGYSSSAEYELYFGKPKWTMDTNKQITTYKYDQFGRTRRIIGPYQTGGER